MYFYEILQSIIDEKEISIAEAARLSGLTDSTVRSIIARKNKTVALEVAFKLSKGLGVSLQRLNGEPEDNSPSVSEENSTNPNPFIFANHLRHLMNQRNINAVELAKNSGLKEADISDYLNGKEEPGRRQSIAIARVMGVSLDVFWNTNLEERQETASIATYRNSNLSREEEELIRKYRTLDDRGKIFVNNLLESQYEYCLGTQGTDKHDTNNKAG